MKREREVRERGEGEERGRGKRGRGGRGRGGRYIYISQRLCNSCGVQQSLVNG